MKKIYLFTLQIASIEKKKQLDKIPKLIPRGKWE
jgi:hypothetical protein